MGLNLLKGPYAVAQTSSSLVAAIWPTAPKTSPPETTPKASVGKHFPASHPLTPMSGPGWETDRQVSGGYSAKLLFT